MIRMQHEETGYITEIEDSDLVPPRWYCIPISAKYSYIFDYFSAIPELVKKRRNVKKMVKKKKICVENKGENEGENEGENTI